MLNNCENCGGKLSFSPKDKANVCESCGSLFPLEYNYQFSKKTFDEHQISAEDDALANSMSSIKCKSCGANVLLSKYQMQTTCPYCGNSSIVKGKAKNMLYIDSLIPFNFSKTEALSKFKSTVRKRFYANKKIFKNINENAINGIYVNAFVFDIETSSSYRGVFSYTRTVKDRDGNSHTETFYKNVSGFFDKAYKNITIEANSHLDQSDLGSIIPFQYGSAVEFKQDFMHGYMLEYQDRIFNDCVKMAEKIINRDIEQRLLEKHGCTKIERLSLHTDYPDKRYNYCLLPVYFVNSEVKGKKYNVLMNGQTGKVGKIPKDKWRVFFTILLIAVLFVGAILLVMYLF